MRLTASGRRPGRFRLILITSLTVGMVLMGYYIYFQAQLEKVHTRNLRLLATMSTQIEQTLLGYSSVVDSFYRSQCKDAAKKDASKKDAPKKDAARKDAPKDAPA